MNTPSVEFLPGDRILNRNGDPGTVKPRPASRTGAEWNVGGPWVYLDLDGSDMDTANVHILQAKRQPIEPGCRVRWIEPMGGYNNLEDCIVKKVETSDWAGVDIVTFTNNLEVYAKDVVRIADPEPVAVAPALPDLIAGKYLPGDRVFTTTAKPDQFGTIGTIDKYGMLPVKWDRQPEDYTTTWTLESVNQFFRHEPVKIGSFVRLHQPKLGDYRYIGKVDRIERWYDDQIAIIAGGGYFVSQLATVVEPKPPVDMVEPTTTTRFTHPDGEPKMTADEKLARAREGMPPWAIIEIVVDTTGRKMIVRNERAEELTRLLRQQQTANIDLARQLTEIRNIVK